MAPQIKVFLEWLVEQRQLIDVAWFLRNILCAIISEIRTINGEVKKKGQKTVHANSS
jgi:hypothetical protein